MIDKRREPIYSCKCVCCGRDFEARRAHAHTCSARCRQGLKRSGPRCLGRRARVVGQVDGDGNVAVWNEEAWKEIQP